MNRKSTPTVGLSSLSLDLLIEYIDKVLSAITKQGSTCEIVESGTELRDLVQSATSDISNLFTGISEASKMFTEQIFLKSQLSTEAQSMAVDVLKGLGHVNLVAVVLLAIGNVLERFDNISANDRECIDLLKAMLRLGKYLKHMKDLNADLDEEILEEMSEAVELIVAGVILCCYYLTSNKLSKLLLTKKIRNELDYVRKNVDSMKANLMLTMNHRQYIVTGGPDGENDLVGVNEKDSPEKSKDTESEIERSRSDTVHLPGQDEHEQLEIPPRSSLGLRRFFKKKTVSGHQKTSSYMELAKFVKGIQRFPLQLSRNELRRATYGFTKQIGNGGSGNVYYGTLVDGRAVAVKMLSKGSRHEKAKWMNELRSLTKLYHRNIVELVGYCFEQDMMLVYDYTAQNLSNVIFGAEANEIIDWPTRLKIILDIIRGLTYLHEGANASIVHGDIKPWNILLEDNYSARICDFGLAREVDDQNDVTQSSNHVTAEVCGTPGYIDPEYDTTGHVSVKSDIYSFGVTLLNIVSGKRATDLTDKLSLPQLAWKLCEEDRLRELIHPRLLNTDNLSGITRTILTALWCIHKESSRRPSASRVLTMLLSKEDIPFPCQPFESLAELGQGHVAMLGDDSLAQESLDIWVCL